ncbi:Auxin-responsive protein SAUR64 [Bienertia sinuspersici]
MSQQEIYGPELRDRVAKDGRQFEVPLFYLMNEVFRNLFRMAEEEFGLPTDRPITLLCDLVFLEYAMFRIRSHRFVDLI